MREINVLCRRVGLLVCLLPAPRFRKATYYIYSSVLDKAVLIYFECYNVGAPLCLFQYKCSVLLYFIVALIFGKREFISFTHFIAETTNINTLKFVGLGRLIGPFSISCRFYLGVGEPFWRYFCNMVFL
jgi:hypothetical protein